MLTVVCLIILFVALPTAWSSPTRQSAATPTSTATVFAEALNPDARIRNQPNIDGEIVTLIQPGESYPVRGYYFEWLLIEYPSSPNGYAWVHESVVALTGDPTGLPQIDPAALPSTRPPTVAPSETPVENAAAITTTPTTEQPMITLTPTATIAGLDFTSLQRDILTYLASRGIVYNGPNSVVSVYVQDLKTGAAMGIQENVLQNAVSTAKIGVIANYFRYIYQPPNQDMEFRLAATVICSSNANANVLMESTDPVDPLNGIRRTSDTFCQGGATNTLIDRHFWIGDAGDGAVPLDYYASVGSTPCPADAASPVDTSVSAVIDPQLHTTAADMGHFLNQLYQCYETGTGLAQIFPDEITQTECQWMMNLLFGTNFNHMMELGVPEGVKIAHKVGYGAEAAGDAGIVFSPNRDYILTVYIWDDRLDNFDSYALARWLAIGEISRLVYNFFNPDAPLAIIRPPSNSTGGSACVLPNDRDAIDLNDLSVGRFDAQGNPLSTACYDWPNCRAFEGWTQ
ncbi:MAG: serine hydrolase [Chloroflexi bacterium]|nr:serine hydrolase [Chloroflexota bacterium]